MEAFDDEAFRESQKNFFIQKKEQQDFRQKDLDDLVRKMKLKTFIIKNKVEENVTIEVFGKKSGELEKFSIGIPSRESISLPILDCYGGLRLIDDEDQENFYINLKESKKDGIKMLIERGERFVFPRSLEKFNFCPNLSTFDPDNLPEWVSENCYREFKSHLEYLNWVLCPGGKIAPQYLFEQRAELFDKYGQRCLVPFRRENQKIPKLIHGIWVTSKDKPIQLIPGYIQYLHDTVAIHPTSEGWKTILWVQDLSLLKLTVDALKGSGVIIKVISELNEKADPELMECFQKALSQKQYGKASDILRIIILLEQGGIYRDTDLAVFQSLRNFTALNFFGCIEPMSTFPCNALIGSTPNHPILKEYARLIKRNMKKDYAPSYIQSIQEGDGFKTIMDTGPGPLMVSFFRMAGQDGNADVLFPPMQFYPTALPNCYPQKDILKPDQPVNPVTATRHDWDGTWTKEEQEKYGSVG